jgi:hypothetical protein
MLFLVLFVNSLYVPCQTQPKTSADATSACALLQDVSDGACKLQIPLLMPFLPVPSHRV